MTSHSAGRAGAILIALLAGFVQAARAAPPVAGEYEGGFQGYLTVKPTAKPDAFQVWLGVGGGSCGGEVLVADRVGRLVGRQLKFAYRMKRRECATTIAFTATGAHVSDTCVSAEEEANSTCAITGDYDRRVLKSLDKPDEPQARTTKPITR